MPCKQQAVAPQLKGIILISHMKTNAVVEYQWLATASVSLDHSNKSKPKQNHEATCKTVIAHFKKHGNRTLLKETTHSMECSVTV